MNFKSGQRVHIRPGSFHNPDVEPKLATFIRYMAGMEYAVLLVNPGLCAYNIRAKVEDLTDED